MDCLMFGLACSEPSFNEYIKVHNNPYSVAHFLFEKEFVNEFEKHYPIYHRYIFQERNKSLKKSIIEGKEENITDKTMTKVLSYINLPFLKHITLFFSTLFSVLSFSMRHKDFFVLSTINYFPIALATQVLSKILGYTNVIIFTDCSEGNAYKGKNKLYSLLVKYKKKVVNHIENSYDLYILFSEGMKDLVDTHNKPFCVMEGFLNTNNIDLTPAERFEKFTVLYAGSIIEELGIQNFAQAFMDYSGDIEFWIVGEGSFKEQLEHICKRDERIKFFGYMDHSNLFEMEKKVALLINTRNPNLLYTRYSFPSKTFEYLASGTPFLSTKLDCYPSEYGDYIFFVTSNEKQVLQDALDYIVNHREDTLKKSKMAKEFVLNNKNSSKQIMKVVDFLHEVDL